MTTSSPLGAAPPEPPVGGPDSEVAVRTMGTPLDKRNLRPNLGWESHLVPPTCGTTADQTCTIIPTAGGHRPPHPNSVRCPSRLRRRPWSIRLDTGGRCTLSTSNFWHCDILWCPYRVISCPASQIQVHRLQCCPYRALPGRGPPLVAGGVRIRSMAARGPRAQCGKERSEGREPVPHCQRPDKFERQDFTLLNATQGQILHQVKDKLPEPQPLKLDGRQRDPNRWCTYYNDNGHDTESSQGPQDGNPDVGRLGSPRPVQVRRDR